MVEVLILVAGMAAWRHYGATWYHCGIGYSRAYLRQIERLTDPNDPLPYREYVVRPWNPRTWQLWRMGVKIERVVFREADNNTAFELWATAVRYLSTTALVVGVDQRRVHAAYPVPYGMIRVSWGSVFGLITLKGVRNRKYWHTRVRAALKLAGMPWYAPYVWWSWDITMIAVLKPYRRKTAYTGDIPAMLGILAQTCRYSEDRRMRYWFTILNKAAFITIQLMTGRPWEPFFGEDAWMPYFGSKKSQPFFCHFHRWMWRLFTEDREIFNAYFRDGMGDWFRYAPRSAPVRDPIKPRDYPDVHVAAHQAPEATAA